MSEEARRRLLGYGPNAVTEERPRLVLALIGKFWAPVPSMLEVTIVLELGLRKRRRGGMTADLKGVA